MLALLLTAFVCQAGLVQDSGIKGGIVVHLNCGDGNDTSKMVENNQCLVHGLDKNAGNISKARDYIQSKKLYGRVSVAQYDGKTLPYCNNLINLIVADNLGDVSMSEVIRVLVPKGIAIIGGKKTIKPWPKNIDTWPQYLNKADNNAVAMDSVVGPPRRIQWMDTPTWSRSHMGISTIASMVTANGRTFTIEDRALPDNPFLPGQFMYIARDSFNGQTLWERKIERWEAITVYIKNLPTQQQRRMVATDDILYCTPALEGPLAALDAATGKTLKTYEDLSPVQEVAYDQGILFVNVGERFNAAAYNNTGKKGKTDKKSTWASRTKGEPFAGGGFRKGYALEIIDKKNPVSSIVAIDAKSGKQLWNTKKLNNYTAATLSVKGDYAVYQTGEGMFCINSKTGKELWSVKKEISNLKAGDSGNSGTMPNTVVLTDDKVFAVEGNRLIAYSLKDGKVLWSDSAMPNYSASVDIFYIDGVVWLAKGNSTTSGLDAETGTVVKKYEQEVTGPMGHDRCYRNLITEKYYINSKTGGTDFVDLGNGNEYPNHWIRGTCGLGILPANGLLYSSPYSCTCSMGDMMPGLNAYSADSELLTTNDSKLIKRKIRLEKGPAYGKASGKAATEADWPIYRGNNFRGGITKNPISPKLNLKWQVKLPGNPTASTVVGDKLYVCIPDTHMLYALDTASGKTDWTFTAGGRIDSPPTYYKGMVLFGSKDGWLYCLRASDGALAWRFKDLPDRLIGAFGQLESAWPIFGSVLVEDNRIYVTAGRSSFLDGGVFFYCLDPVSGKLLNSRSSYGPFNKTTGRPVGFNVTGRLEDFANLKKKKDADKLFLPEREGYFPGFKNDLLVSDGKSLHMRHCSFNKNLEDISPITDRLMPLSSFLDRRVQHRTGFIFKHNLLGWKNNPSDLMITDNKEIFNISGFRGTTNHTYFDPRANSYTLSGGSLKKVPLTINGRALAKAGDVIFVAGEQMKFKEPTWLSYVDSYSGKLGGKLIAISVKDGKELASYKLESSIVWDSIALAGGKLYISLTDGTIQCYGE